MSRRVKNKTNKRKQSKTLRLMKAKNKSLKVYQKINCRLRKTKVKENKQSFQRRVENGAQDANRQAKRVTRRKPCHCGHPDRKIKRGRIQN